MKPSKLLPLAGIAFIALFAIAFTIGGSTPDPHASGSELASYYQTHDLQQAAAAFALSTSVPLFVLFTVALVTASWREVGSEQWVWQLVLAIGSAVTSAAILVAATVHFALTDGAGHVSGQGLQALNMIDGDIWMIFNPALGVMMVGAAGTLTTGVHRRLGLCAAALGVALFVPIVDFFAVLATAAWILVASVALRRDQGAARSLPQSSATPLAREGTA